MWAVGIALFFAAADALSLRIQALDFAAIPFQLSLMLPLVLTLVVYGFGRPGGPSSGCPRTPWMKA